MNIRRALMVAIVGALIWEFARAESTVVDTQLGRGDFHSVLDAVKTAGTHFLEPSKRSRKCVPAPPSPSARCASRLAGRQSHVGLGAHRIHRFESPHDDRADWMSWC